VHVGPSDYVPWLSDRKWAFIRLEGKSFGDVPLNMELKLEVHDSPNSAGIVIDAVRFCKLALDNKVSGSLFGPSSWLMKSPPEQYHDDVAHRLAEAFIAKPVGRPGRTSARRRVATTAKRVGRPSKTSARRRVAATAQKADAAATYDGNGRSGGTRAAALSAKTIAPAAPRAVVESAGRGAARSRSRAANS
jgi:hypothetical protein